MTNTRESNVNFLDEINSAGRLKRAVDGREMPALLPTITITQSDAWFMVEHFDALSRRTETPA